VGNPLPAKTVPVRYALQLDNNYTCIYSSEQAIFREHNSNTSYLNYNTTTPSASMLTLVQRRSDQSTPSW